LLLLLKRGWWSSLVWRAPPLPMSVSLQFRVECKATKPGQAVFIVGSLPELGAWDPTKGLPCATSGQHFPIWTSATLNGIRRPAAGTQIEFKLVVAKDNGSGSPKWEDGGNRTFQFTDAAVFVVSCVWGAPGCEVQAKGPKASESEKKSRPVSFTGTNRPVSFTLLQAVEEDEPLEEKEPEEEAVIEQRDCSVKMQRQGSRHIFSNSDGSLNIDMSRTPSLMMIDLTQFEAEAEAKEVEMREMERDRLNEVQRRMESGCLLEQMKQITDFADPSKTVMLQGFNWESWHASKTEDWYSIVGHKVDFLAEIGITDIWLPPPSASVAPQGYLPSQLFNLDGSKYGSQKSLEDLIYKMHEAGIRAVADIVINHRCGDKQDSQGKWNVFTSGMNSRPSFAGVMDWQGWAVTLGSEYSDGTGEHAPNSYDQSFDAAPDIDHANDKVRESIRIWLRWLRLQVGFDAWRFDFVKGYAAEHVGYYCKKSEPSWAVGELWCDMRYDHDGLAQDQDKHRQDTINWINSTGKTCTAFDFTTKGCLQEAVKNCQYYRLKDKGGKPPGLLGWMPSHAVTFIDNHDTGSTQGHWPFPSDKVLVGYAYILTHPGIPSIFWDHLFDWGENKRNVIKGLLQARQESGIPFDAPVNIKCAEQDLYLAEIGKPPALRVALGPRDCNGGDGSYWTPGPMGDCFKVWVKKKSGGY